MEETIGACRFCGQVRHYADGLELGQEELNENATVSCTCAESRAYKDKVTTKKRFDKMREEEILRGSLRIDELFGEGAGQYELESVSDDIIDLLNNLIILVIDDELKAVSINISSKTKVTISKNTKDRVSIIRTENATHKKEV